MIIKEAKSITQLLVFFWQIHCHNLIFVHFQLFQPKLFDAWRRLYFSSYLEIKLAKG
jgi:hypothetical protein